MAEPLSLTVSLRGTREVKENYQLFRLNGQLDAFSEPTFRKVMEKCVEEGPGNLILDLSKIDFVDSSGIGAGPDLLRHRSVLTKDRVSEDRAHQNTGRSTLVTHHVASARLAVWLRSHNRWR